MTAVMYFVDLNKLVETCRDDEVHDLFAVSSFILLGVSKYLFTMPILLPLCCTL
jgi:hypothetical protein